MTRINVGIDPSELNTKMLVAEHRELKRIPNCVRKGRFSMKGQPKEFTLNTGHVKFFYDKLNYLRIRYESLYAECIRRTINVQYFGDSFNGIDPIYMGDYVPSERDRNMLLDRIKERLTKSK
jgi:deoxyribonuclease (pyrimidine dimer)